MMFSHELMEMNKKFKDKLVKETEEIIRSLELKKYDSSIDSISFGFSVEGEWGFWVHHDDSQERSINKEYEPSIDALDEISCKIEELGIDQVKIKVI